VRLGKKGEWGRKNEIYDRGENIEKEEEYRMG
jgi:hypothetical protein